MPDHRQGLAQLTGARKKLAIAVGIGAAVIATIGFAGSYAAVVGLAREKGFGDFAEVFPIGIDAGIGVLLALDLLLSWIRIPFPILRHIAWMLTAATIAFNAAAAWPDPIAVGMHASMPVLFVVVVEAVRHAVGRLADITADRHMEGVRVWRWALAPAPTFKLWRRMKLWELRGYEQAVGMEQDRLIYRAHLRAEYGRRWRRKAPVEAVLPLRLAKLGVPLTETAPAGLAAAGIEIVWRPAALRVPAFEEHVLEAVAVVDRPAEPLPPLRALIPAPTSAYAAKGEPKARMEVTARLPEEELEDCEDEVLPAEPAREPAPTAPGNEAGDESTKPPVAPEENGNQEQPVPPPAPQVDPLAAHRARIAQETAVLRSAIREKWDAAKEGNPKLTKAAFARMTEWTEAQVYAALKAHT
ncbi:DUF2637 domain-containing protein [Streptomyces goshikiensis]|uniref:DUF2637 domain-containing protein n=1 Tax=Streptomyces goshikiensis TaxID=1942 RepID=UPI0037B2481E